MAFNFLTKRTLLVVLLFLLSFNIIYAHPHMTIQAYSYNYFNDKGLMGVYLQWEYDPMFSSQLIYNYDVDQNMEFSESEIGELKLSYFDNIVDSNYYTYFKLDNKKISNPEPVSFKAVIDKEDEVIVMSFYIPLNIDYQGNQQLTYGYEDKTQYTAFYIPQRELWNKGDNFNISKKHINRLGEVKLTFSEK